MFAAALFSIARIRKQPKNPPTSEWIKKMRYVYIMEYSVPCLVNQSCVTLCHPMDCSPPSFSIHGDSPGKNTGMVSMPSSKGTSQPRDRTQVSCFAGGFFAFWATREVHEY